jgi:fructokinase
MENGERDFYFNRGADGQLSVDDIAGIDLSEFSIIHFGSATSFLPGPLKSAYVELLHRALKTDILVSFDPNYRHLLFKGNMQTFVDQSWNFLNRCHFFKVSDEEAMLLTGTETLDEAVAALSTQTEGVFAITLGKDGTLLGLNKQTYIVPSIPVKPVDTTGAGDAFVGAVLYQLSSKTADEVKGMSVDDWKIIVGNANKAGARTCEYMGAMEAFKHLNKAIFQ